MTPEMIEDADISGAFRFIKLGDNTWTTCNKVILGLYSPCLYK